MMDESTKDELEVSKYLGWFHSYGIHGPWSCLQCGTVIRKPRYLKSSTTGGRRFVTLSWCSQECLDVWGSQFHLPAMRWEKYDEDGILIGYVVPRRGFVSLEQIENAQLEKDQGES